MDEATRHVDSPRPKHRALVNTTFVSEFDEERVDVTIVSFVEPPVGERGLKDMRIEEDLVVVCGRVGDSPCHTPLLDPLPAEFTEGRGDSAVVCRQGETFKISAPRKFRAIIELTCG